MGILVIDVYRFSNVGNIFLRKETVGIPLPAHFIPSRSPRGDFFINSKIVYQSGGEIQEGYVPQTVSELYEMIQQESVISDSEFNSRMDQINLQSYDPSVFTIVNNAVSQWTGYGTSGRNALQSTSTRRPLYNNGEILLDGIDDRMDFSSEIELTEFTLYIVLKKNAATSGVPIGSSSRLDFLQYTAARQATLFKAAGGFTPYNLGTLENYNVISIRMNGSSSVMKANDRTVLNLSNNINSGAFRIGRIGTSSSGSAPYGGIIRAVCVSTEYFSDERDQENREYLYNKYSLPLESEYGILGFGDSITQGSIPSGITPWLTTLSTSLGKPFINLGIAGTQFTNYSHQNNNGFDRYQAQIITRPYNDYIVVPYGINDISTVSAANFGIQHREVFARLIDDGYDPRRLVPCSLFRKLNDADAPTMEAYRDQALNTSVIYNTLFADIYYAAKAHPDPNSLMFDEVHPNQLGHNLMAETIEDTIQAG